MHWAYWFSEPLQGEVSGDDGLKVCASTPFDGSISTIAFMAPEVSALAGPAAYLPNMRDCFGLSRYALTGAMKALGLVAD